MSEQTFPIADVLGTITGVLLSEDIGGIYRVSEFMCGHPVWTHQLPRIGKEIRPVVLGQHPHLAPVLVEAQGVTQENWRERVADWTLRFGETLVLKPMAKDKHVRTNPVAEAVDMVGPDRVVVAVVPA